MSKFDGDVDSNQGLLVGMKSSMNNLFQSERKSHADFSPGQHSYQHLEEEDSGTKFGDEVDAYATMAEICEYETIRNERFANHPEKYRQFLISCQQLKIIVG